MTDTAATIKTNLIGLERDALQAWFERAGQRPFHARQFMKWVYRRGVDDFDAMTDLSKSFRSVLKATATLALPPIRHHHQSTDGTQKWVLGMDSGQSVETVFIPEPNRGTLCISSQVGCALDCTFCATGAQGYNRNLSTAEIVGQVWLANRELGYSPETGRIISNVVFMGMGEPLANYRQVVPALKILQDDFGFELSRRRVTLSTSGLVPQIRRLGQDANAALAVSLHAPNDPLRNQLVPINRKHPIGELLPACWQYLRDTAGRSVTFEYVLLDGVNDQPVHARELAALLAKRPAKVNLIPFNPFPGTRYRRSPGPAIERFQNLLLAAGVRATVRRTRGDDISAACGQLAGEVRDRVTSRLGAKPTLLEVQR